MKLQKSILLACLTLMGGLAQAADLLAVKGKKNLTMNSDGTAKVKCDPAERKCGDMWTETMADGHQGVMFSYVGETKKYLIGHLRPATPGGSVFVPKTDIHRAINNVISVGADALPSSGL